MQFNTNSPTINSKNFNTKVFSLAVSIQGTGCLTSKEPLRPGIWPKKGISLGDFDQMSMMSGVFSAGEEHRHFWIWLTTAHCILGALAGP